MSRRGVAVALAGALCGVALLAGTPAGPATVPASAAADPSRDAASARAEARRILSGRRYTGTTVRGPFRGLLERLGRQIDRLGEIIPSIDARLPGGRLVTWLVIVAIVAGASFGLAQQTAHRRAAAVIAQAEQSSEGGRERPAAIERRAEEAERAGDFAEAVRLRFHAGLLRLDARGLIEYRPSLGTAAVAHRLHSPEFDRLAGRFDEIVYGGRAATAADAEASRSGWAAVAKAAA